MIHNAHLEGDTFFLAGGPVGILLSHGYSATTAEVRLLAHHLHAQGYTVSGLLLPGHGTTPKAMNRCRWPDWTEAIEEAYQALQARCDRVFVGGESMGALLALYTADQHPEIAGILAYAPALQIARRSVMMSYLASPFLPYVHKKNLDTMNKNWQGYAVNPVPAVVQLHRLQREIKRRLPTIQQPLLIVQGRLDKTIDLQGIDTIYNNIGATDKELHWMENSGHLLILEEELQQVGDITVRFIERVLERVGD